MDGRIGGAEHLATILHWALRIDYKVYVNLEMQLWECAQTGGLLLKVAWVQPDPHNPHAARSWRSERQLTILPFSNMSCPQWRFILQLRTMVETSLVLEM
jgi:hypothetical protein